ncbi:cytochrome P450 2D3-like [Danio aesculapii]|uniref:cytochrome P450 2D3-like n=1 Tax=Danio aesculapii TaxID=1142201 RepID=UPI0024C0DB2A|nr:cytochrome P450 2D3-like [Danio aesculapii]
MLGSSLLVIICILLIFFLIRVKRPNNFPPGPPPIPIFGNLLQINLANPLKDFERFAEKYGNIFSFYTGSRPAVLLNSFAVIKDALVTKAQDFSGRPQDFMISHATENKGIVLADYGPVLKDHRRFALMTLRNFGLGKHSMEERILGEISHILDYLDYPTNLICINNNLRFYVLFYQIYDTFPVLRILPLPFKKAFDNVKIIKSMNQKLIDEHKSTRVPGEPRDFIDCYLDELDKGKNCVSTFCEDKLLMNIMDLHFAGTDTISNTLLTAFLYLMNHPEVQVKCQQEIDDVLEGKDQASYEDRHNMPYTQAVIHEVQRVSNTVPLSVFHSTTRDTELMGYNIPKGTIIIPNLTSVLKEDGQWKFPHEFNPANFLNEQGQFEKPEAFIPFSAGLRVCLGESLARMELFLVFVTLLRRFQFVWPEDAGKPDYTPVFGLTFTPKPYRMHIRQRDTVKQ